MELFSDVNVPLCAHCQLLGLHELVVVAVWLRYLSLLFQSLLLVRESEWRASTTDSTILLVLVGGKAMAKVRRGTLDEVATRLSVLVITERYRVHLIRQWVDTVHTLLI